MSRSIEPWINISHAVAFLGPLKLYQLYTHYRSAEKLAACAELRQYIEKVDVKQVLKTLSVHKISTVTILDNEYPPLLKEITDPPLALYYQGSLPADTPAIAIVGTRKPTNYGMQAAELFAKELSHAGAVVVSGLAYGIDSIAHQATLEAGGLTIAVVPSGLDTIYPRQHDQLARRIRSQGAVVSEYPPGTVARKHHFGVRNRIIAGLSLGTVIIEAADHSGTLLTARSTMEYNRELFAVPHPIFSAMGLGPNELIKRGAKLVTSAKDVIEELNLAGTLPLDFAHGKSKEFLPESPEEVAIIGLITEGPRHVDELVQQSGLPVARVQSTLVLLELKAVVRNLGGNFYVRS